MPYRTQSLCPAQPAADQGEQRLRVRDCPELCPVPLLTTNRWTKPGIPYRLRINDHSKHVTLLHKYLKETNKGFRDIKIIKYLKNTMIMFVFPSILLQPNRVFSHDVTAAMLVSQNKEMAAMLVSQTKPLGIELYFYANTFFCFSKPIWPVVT